MSIYMKDTYSVQCTTFTIFCRFKTVLKAVLNIVYLGINLVKNNKTELKDIKKEPNKRRDMLSSRYGVSTA